VQKCRMMWKCCGESIHCLLVLGGTLLAYHALSKGESNVGYPLLMRFYFLWSHREFQAQVYGSCQSFYLYMQRYGGHIYE